MEQEFIKTIEIISTQLGIAAEKIFNIFVGAQPAIGIVNILSVIVIIIATYFVYKFAHRIIMPLCKDEDGDWRDNDAQFIGLLIPLIIVVVFVCIFAVLMSIFNENIIRIICPEYTAIQEIIRLIR